MRIRDWSSDVCSSDLGPHHLLNADRKGHVHMVEALGLAVADRPVGEERRIAAAACVKQRPPAPDVQKRLLLAGKAGVGQVLGGGAAATGGCRLGPAPPFAQLLLGAAYPVALGGRT